MILGATQILDLFREIRPIGGGNLFSLLCFCLVHICCYLHPNVINAIIIFFHFISSILSNHLRTSAKATFLINNQCLAEQSTESLNWQSSSQKQIHICPANQRQKISISFTLDCLVLSVHTACSVSEAFLNLFMHTILRNITVSETKIPDVSFSYSI